jgi:hypothetical protein
MQKNILRNIELIYNKVNIEISANYFKTMIKIRLYGDIYEMPYYSSIYTHNINKQTVCNGLFYNFDDEYIDYENNEIDYEINYDSDGNSVYEELTTKYNGFIPVKFDFKEDIRHSEDGREESYHMKGLFMLFQINDYEINNMKNIIRPNDLPKDLTDLEYISIIIRRKLDKEIKDIKFISECHKNIKKELTKRLNK